MGNATKDQIGGHSILVTGVKISCLNCNKMVNFDEVNEDHLCRNCASLSKRGITMEEL